MFHFLQLLSVGKLLWYFSDISILEVPLRSVESLLVAEQRVPSMPEKVGNIYRLQGSVEKVEAVLSTEVTVAVHHE